jgi:hypothetical protein
MYNMSDSKCVMQISKEIQFTLQAIEMVKTPGQVAYGKMMLENARDIMEDIDQIHIFNGILDSAGIPMDLDLINLDDDIPDQHYHRPTTSEPPPTWDNFMSGSQYGSISQFMIDELAGGISMMGPTTADPGQLTADYAPSSSNPQPQGRIRNPRDPYTPGTDALGPPRARRRRR